MKSNFWTIILFVLLAGCSDQVWSSYDNLNDAIKDGALKKGWMPSFMPESSTNILMVNDIDTNIVIIKCTIDEGDIQLFKNNCTEVQSEKDIRYFGDTVIEGEPEFRRFECNGKSFVEILNNRYVFYSNDI